MKTWRFIAFGFLALSSVGHATNLPKVPPNGKYGVMFFAVPVIEFEYSSAESCVAEMIRVQDSYMSLGVLLTEGRVGIACNSVSLESKLPYQSEVRNVLTGQIIQTRTHAKDACVKLSKVNTDLNMKYSCAEE